MTTKPESIAQLEKTIKKPLERLQHPHSWAKAQSYAVDDNGNIITLNLRDTGIKTLELGTNFQYLRRLDLSKNQLSQVIFTSAMPDLELLDVSYNQSEWEKLVLPEGCDGLKYLYAYDAKLKNIEFKSGVSALEDIVLKKNDQLSSPPPEIVEKGLVEIVRFFKQIEEQGIETINEAKLIIVGEGKSGKTTLFKKLIDPSYKLEILDETHGINIYEGLKMQGDFKANLWDFGGQELQYMTHQFFITPSALYLLMMDARTESPNLSYWLKIISLLGKKNETDKVRLILVTNKHKDDTTGTPQYQSIIDIYKEDFQYQVLDVNFSKNDTRWALLKESIELQLHNLPIVKTTLPKQWKSIRDALREEAKGNAYITTDRLNEICKKYKVPNEDDQWQMTDYLHKLGSLLHFQEDNKLKCDVFLQPKWVVEGVYTVLKSTLIKEEQKGKFTAEDIFHILRGKGYGNTESQKILNLMSKNNFDICYESEAGHYVATQLLPKNPPPQYVWETHAGALQFRYQYTTMPKGLISRLIVQLSHLLEKIDGVDIVYKQGAILRFPVNSSTCRVMLKEDDAESKTSLKQIIIEVMEEGNHRNNRKYALHQVRTAVETLHNKWFRNIKVEQIVPCNCDKCRFSTDPFTYEFSELLTLTEGFAFCNRLQKTVPLKQILEGVYETKEIQSIIHDEGNEKMHPHIHIHIENNPIFNNSIENKTISQIDLQALEKLLKQLTDNKQDRLKEYIETLPEPEDSEEKTSIGKQIMKWLNKNAEGIVLEVAAASYYDGLKLLLGIG